MSKRRRRISASSLQLAGLLSVCVASLAHAEGVAPGPAPVSGQPLRCFSPGDDVYCLMEDGALVGLQSRAALLRLGTGAGFRVNQRVCDVGPDGEAACLYTESRSEGPEKQPYTRKHLVLTHAGHTAILADGVVDQGFAASAYGVFVRNGVVSAAFMTREPKGPYKTVISVNGQRMDVSLPSESFGNALAGATGERIQPTLEFFAHRDALWAITRDGTDLQVAKVGPQMTWATIAEHSMYDFRTIVGRDGYIYVFFHDYSEDSAMVASSADANTWRITQLDDEESGWQLDAAPAGYGVVASWYYMRNTYNKGLRSAFLRDGQLLQPSHTLMRNGQHNAGWCPQLGTTDHGTTWLSWLDNVVEHERAWTKLASPVDLGEVRIARYRDWRDRHKPWFVQAGIGAWYTLWNSYDLKVDAKETGGVAVGRANRRLANSVLAAGMFEAKLWRIQLAAGYAQSIIEAADERLTGKLSSYLGSLKYDHLLPGHDVQVRGTFGRYTGRGTPGTNGDSDEVGPLRIDTKYWHAQALALNKWRIKYGLSYARFRLPTTVHTYGADAGQTAYRYTGAYFRTVRFDDIRLLLGYSTLDYVARYENHYSGINVDADLLVGLSMMEFAPVAPDGFSRTGKSFGISFGAHLDLGWLWMSRIRALGGLGVYVRPLYRAEFDGAFGTFKPDDRKPEDAKKADLSAGASIMSVRHGPWLDIGLVW